MPNALPMMKASPDQAFKTYGYIPSDGGGRDGRCKIKITKLFNQIYLLEPDFSGAGAFYFSYGRYKSPSHVDVPFGQPNGTIAFTAPMNGCSLQVNKTGSGFAFYHDPLSTSMSGQEPGEIVCRVGPKDYDRFNRGSQAIENERTSSFGGTYGIAIISIHHEGKWKVYSSPVAGPVNNKGKLAGAYVFTASITPFLASFDDG